MRYENNPDLIRFLRENTHLIISTFNKSGTRNLRILKHALNDFKKIFETVNKTYPNTKLRVLQTMLIFTIAVSFEIKAGKVTKNKFININTNEEYKALLVSSRVLMDNRQFYIKEFDKMKLLKCLYYQQKKYKLLTILGKSSLQIVDNSSMIGTGFHSYNEYGDIIKNFKEEIGKCISPDTSLFFEQFLLLAIRCAEYPCSYLESNDFVERPEFQNTMNYVLPVVKYSLDRTLEDLRNDHEHKKIENTIFEVMYLKTIVFENIGREKDFILMTSIFSEIDKLLGPTTKDIESDIIAYKALKVYIEKNIGKIARYFKQNNCNNKKLESDILKVIPKLELLLEWREKHAMGKRPGKKPANALFFVQLIAFLEILLILKNQIQ